MKFVDRDSEFRSNHWSFCEKGRLPYIEVSDSGRGYRRIFFDVTNYDVDLEEISNQIQSFYKAYVDFFMLPAGDVRECFEQHYFFSMLVRSEHSDFIANGLYDLLIFKLQKKE